MIEYAADPPSDVLQVIDPRPHTSIAAALQARYRLSTAAADLLGASIHYSTAIHVIVDNIGRNWAEICDIEESSCEPSLAERRWRPSDREACMPQ